MVKVVYNAQHGGFSLSDFGVNRYAQIKGMKLYPEINRAFSFITYWLVPESERDGIVSDDDWRNASDAEKIASNRLYEKLTLDPRNIERTDPALVQVVEELGDAANGAHARLRIRELPSGARYRIDEYDGRESVMTVDDYEWQTA